MRIIKYVVVFLAGISFSFLAERYQSVIDGDTLFIGKQKVRLVGIDAPELKQMCRCAGENSDCGLVAKKELYRLIGSRSVSCRSTGRDFYGRLIAECFIEKDGREFSLNALMVENGWAVSSKYDTRFFNEELFAMENKLGLWRCEYFQDPADFRKTH